MSSRRTLILLGAITVGLVSAFLLFSYLDGLGAPVVEVENPGGFTCSGVIEDDGSFTLDCVDR